MLIRIIKEGFILTRNFHFQCLVPLSTGVDYRHMNPLFIGHHTHLMKELTTIEKVKEIKLKNKDEKYSSTLSFFHLPFSTIHLTSVRS
jgi:hypothetical protein